MAISRFKTRKDGTIRAHYRTMNRVSRVYRTVASFFKSQTPRATRQRVVQGRVHDPKLSVKQDQIPNTSSKTDPKYVCRMEQAATQYPILLTPQTPKKRKYDDAFQHAHTYPSHDSDSELVKRPRSHSPLSPLSLLDSPGLSDFSNDPGEIYPNADRVIGIHNLSESNSSEVSDLSANESQSSSEYEHDEDESGAETKPDSSCRVSRNGGSRRTNNSEIPYCPFPKRIDKKLAGSIDPLVVHESDLSDEEIYNSKRRLRKGDKKEVSFEFSMEKAKRWTAAVKLPSGQWAEAERDLFFRLAMRGFEPLLPSNWKMDFATLPETLFAPSNSGTAYLAPVGQNEFRAIKFLNDLMAMGGRVRDRLLCQLRPEPFIQHCLRKYTRWTFQDANLHNRLHLIPPYAIHSIQPGQTTRMAVDAINSRLIDLANYFRSSWRLNSSVEIDPNAQWNHSDAIPQYQDRTYPVLTGFLICGPMVALITLDSDPKTCPVLDSTTSGRLIARFDFSEYGLDVWNSLAVAIAVVRLRNTILTCEKEGRGDPMWAPSQASDEADDDL
ncbi:hypothetical protein FQN57_007477 [Myotisia sp. PD_48]|nr:hypothetical protein FQN57_007477 [Myotisia sp. PD_48]